MGRYTITITETVDTGITRFQAMVARLPRTYQVERLRVSTDDNLVAEIANLVQPKPPTPKKASRV